MHGSRVVSTVGLLLAMEVVGSSAWATTLGPGDLVITGVNADDPDQFVFVPLVDLDAGTEIHFTDNGLHSDGTFRANEGVVTYSVPAGGVAAGTALVFEAPGSADFTTSGSFSLSASGDQVIAYQGDAASPNFLFAVQTNSTQWQVGSDDSNQSDLPPGLTDGVTAVALGWGPGAEDEWDNAEYLGPTSGSASELLAAVADTTNWVGDNTRIALEVTDFTFGGTGEGDPDPIDPVSGCGMPDATPIWAIQGASDLSPHLGEQHTIEGVVVGAFQATDGGGLSGFFVQEEDADADGDPTTSDGVFVYDPAHAIALAVGEVVRVTGTVAEYARSSDTSGQRVTELTNVQGVERCTELTGDATPALVALPLASDPATDLEAVEGMAVDLIAAEGELTLIEYFNLDRYGEIRVAAGERPMQFTAVESPDSIAYAAHLSEMERSTLLVDDGRSGQNLSPIAFGRAGLPLDVQADPANLLRGGDTVSLIAGVMHYDFGVYRLEPVESPLFMAANARPSTPPVVDGGLKVVSYNVLNYFQQLDDGAAKCGPPGALQECRGADQGPLDGLGRNERDRQEAKLVPALLALDADVYGLIELENDFGYGNGNSVTSAQRLADLMNAANAVEPATDCNRYAAVDPGVYVGTDAIAVGMIYCEQTVQLAPGTRVEILSDEDLAALDLAGLAPLFDGESTNRAPLAVSFEEIASGERFTVVVNHFKSKGASGLDEDVVCQETPALDPNCDQGDGAGYWNRRRTDAASALAAWLATDPTGSGDADVLILGDLNAYAMEDPVAVLVTAGYENLIARIGDGAYSYLYDGQIGYLDYALANASLAAQVAGVAEWHINADEPDALDYDISFNPEAWYALDAFRTSDHDPVVVGLALAAPAVPGDLDGDGDVDASDYALFRQALGSRAGDARWLPGADCDGDGVVSYRDYQIWYGYWRSFVAG